MKISLVAYAMVREAFPHNPLEYEVPEGITSGQLVILLSKDFPEIKEILQYTRVGHEDEYLDKEAILKSNNEYVLIPPVSGG